jgi:eukaryotic-like serine/threonine-protein kinase
MRPHVNHEIARARATAILAELGETIAAGATIGRSGLHEAFDVAALPRLSLDEGALRRGGVPAAERGADLQLTSLLGEGGMGAVYSARQRALNRDVAIKRLHSGETSERARDALLGEARVMGGLEHPNIVPVHALGCDEDGLPILVMKRVEGVAWQALLDDPSHPMWSELVASHERRLVFHLNVLASVCNALRFAHDRGVIHRDIKPENVMIGVFGEVYLLDWGVACRLEGPTDDRIVGTLAYMAPEMVLAPGSADQRTDVYLLGSVLHQILTGLVLHDGTSVSEVLCAIMLAEPRDVHEYADSVPSVLAELCVAATHPDPSRRPPSVEAFGKALAAYAAHRASQDLAASALEKLDEADLRIDESSDAIVEMEVGVLLAECRFGLEQSLQQWPENDAARRGLQRCLERAFERELRLRNASAARALLAALPDRRSEMDTRLETLERELGDARALEERNAELARERDASVSAVPRFLLFGAMLLVVTGASFAAYLEEQRSGHTMTMADQLTLDFTMLSFLTIGLLVGRRRLFTNTFNRITWALWYIAFVAIIISDVHLGLRGFDGAYVTSPAFGIATLVFIVGAVTFDRTLLLVALPLGITSVLTGFMPSAGALIATIGAFIAIAVNMELTRRAAASKSARAR